MKRIFFYLAGVLFLWSCDSSEKIEIKGTIKNGEGKEVQLNELTVSGTTNLDKKEIGKKESFRFTTSSEYPRFYHLALSKNNFLTLLLEPGEKVQIKADATNLTRDRKSVV